MKNNNNTLKVKRALDITVSLIALILLSPLFIAVAIVIKLQDKGSIFFQQNRGGLNGVPFQILKFRTMKNNSSKKHATKGDARITKIGSLLRKTSIDELPQLINVLKGDMSLVGPRPHMLEHDKKYAQKIDSYDLRFQAKPGLTGLAQVKGFRGNIDSMQDMQDRVNSDIEYIKNWSLVSDINIALLTIPAVIIAKNAY